MMPNKIQLILPILFLSCSFVTDSKDSDSTVNPLVGTWNVTTYKTFDNLDCSGDPVGILDVNSEDDLAYLFGLDYLQTKLTITVDLYLITHETRSTTSSIIMEESATTGVLIEKGDQICFIRDDIEDPDTCDACRDYTINGDELELYHYNCPSPFPAESNIPCIIITHVKK